MRYTVAFYVSSVPITLDVRDGRASLGGSESACFGLARAFAALGHDVHIHAQRLSADAIGKDGWGVTWHDAGEADEALYAWCEVVEPDVFVSLRMAHVFSRPIRARLRVLWNQDLLVGQQGSQLVMSTAWQVDRYVYVSDYHRQQWEGVCPDLRGLAYVTRNGFDPAHVPTDVAKVPGRICYVTRPERGLGPLLQMWPALKAAVPHAELHITRYQSMYDGEGGAVKAMCEAYDRQTQAVAEQVGGIVVHPGGLGKADLYRLIASSEVMWYPGVADFAETSCVAAVEAQACGTAFVGSKKGALPETVPHGYLVDCAEPLYQNLSSNAVVSLLNDHDPYTQYHWANRIERGRKHVQQYTYAAIAQDWTDWLTQTFTERRHQHRYGVIRQLLQYDDHTAALQATTEELADHESDYCEGGCTTADQLREWRAFCQRVIAGQDQTAEDYGDRAEPDVLKEVQRDGRIQAAAEKFVGRTRVLDVACGNGSFAIALALRDPHVQVVGLDYSEANIQRARAAAERLGLGERLTFARCTIYDYDAQDVTDEFRTLVATHKAGGFEGAFCGEFLEHVANCTGLVDAVNAAVTADALVVWTMPSGPFTEMMPPGVPIKRGHVHHFAYDDIVSVFGTQAGMEIGVLQIGPPTPRGNPVAHWLISYRTSGTPAGARDYTKRILTTRPMPTLTVGLIAGDTCALDLPRCLETIKHIADDLVIGDCGLTEAARAVAVSYGARIVPIGSVNELAGGFAEARNRVLDAGTGDWFLWVDTDEQVVGSTALRKYLDGAVFDGYILRQNHLQLDAPAHYDEPVRLFRRTPAIRFYGCVHEQPQQGDANGNVWPTLAVTDVQIAHYGYLTEGVRRRKSQARNLPLLVRDRQQFPDRRLGRVLWMREYATWLSQLAQGEPAYRDALQMIGGELGAQGLSETVFDGQPIPLSGTQLAAFAADYYERHFPDPTDALAKLARPFYEAALRMLPGSWEIDFAFAGTQGGLKGRAKPSRFWTRSFADAQAMVAAHMAPLGQAFEPAPIHTDPFPAQEAA